MSKYQFIETMIWHHILARNIWQTPGIRSFVNPVFMTSIMHRAPPNLEEYEPGTHFALKDTLADDHGRFIFLKGQ